LVIGIILLSARIFKIEKRPSELVEKPCHSLY
jgi:hypothetical protein